MAADDMRKRYMKALRQLLHRTFQPSPSRFERYYAGLLGQGTGYPTADEARRDLARFDRAHAPYLWPR
jgi:hypothetical protein